MPTYEYACTECGHHVEKVQSFSDEPLTVCPDCGGPLRKVFGSVGIVLKGSGFYKTDNRRPASVGASSTSESGGAGGSSTESSGASTSGSGTAGDSGSSTTPAKSNPKSNGASSNGSGSSGSSGSTTSAGAGKGSSGS